MNTEQLQQKVLASIRNTRKLWKDKEAKYEIQLLEEVVVLRWLREDKPDAFDIPSFEHRGRLRCLVASDPQDGFIFINVWLWRRRGDEAPWHEVDVNDVLFSVQQRGIREQNQKDTAHKASEALAKQQNDLWRQRGHKH